MARKAPACLPGSESSGSSVLSRRTLGGDRLNEFLLRHSDLFGAHDRNFRMPDGGDGRTSVVRESTFRVLRGVSRESYL